MLMHTVVVDNGHIARLPIIADAVVHLVTFAIKNVECSFVYMAMFLRFAAGTIFFKMKVKQLANAVLWLYVVTTICLRTVNELDFTGLTDAGHST